MTTATATQQTSRALRGLRLQLYIVIVLLAVEIVLGIATNLFAKLPANDKGLSLFAGFGAAIGSGPVSLALHAIVGSLLVLAAISVIIRAVGSRNALQVVLAIVGLVVLVGAWMSGSGFIGNQTDGASFGMSLSTGIALLGYATALFTAGGSSPARSAGE